MHARFSLMRYNATPQKVHTRRICLSHDQPNRILVFVFLRTRTREFLFWHERCGPRFAIKLGAHRVPAGVPFSCLAPAPAERTEHSVAKWRCHVFRRMRRAGGALSLRPCSASLIWGAASASRGSDHQRRCWANCHVVSFSAFGSLVSAAHASNCHERGVSRRKFGGRHWISPGPIYHSGQRRQRPALPVG